MSTTADKKNAAEAKHNAQVTNTQKNRDWNQGAPRSQRSIRTPFPKRLLATYIPRRRLRAGGRTKVIPQLQGQTVQQALFVQPELSSLGEVRPEARNEVSHLAPTRLLTRGRAQRSLAKVKITQTHWRELRQLLPGELCSVQVGIKMSTWGRERGRGNGGNETKRKHIQKIRKQKQKSKKNRYRSEIQKENCHRRRHSGTLLTMRTRGRSTTQRHINTNAHTNSQTTRKMKQKTRRNKIRETNAIIPPSTVSILTRFDSILIRLPSPYMQNIPSLRVASFS